MPARFCFWLMVTRGQKGTESQAGVQLSVSPWGGTAATLSPLIPGCSQCGGHGRHKANKQVAKAVPFPGAGAEPWAHLCASGDTQTLWLLCCFPPCPSSAVTSFWDSKGAIPGDHPHPRNHKPGSWPGPFSWPWPYLQCWWHIKGASTCSPRLCSLLGTPGACPHSAGSALSVLLQPHGQKHL